MPVRSCNTGIYESRTHGNAPYHSVTRPCGNVAQVPMHHWDPYQKFPGNNWDGLNC